LRALVLVIALLLPATASAGKTVGLLVTGEALSTPTQDQAAKWLRAQGRGVVTDPLSSAAVKTLLDCFVIDDSKCARAVVDQRATVDSMVSIRIDIVSKKNNEVRLTIDWFAKGSNPVSARRTCEACNDAVLRTTLDEMLQDLAKTSPGFMGRVKLTSKPPGFTVLLDNETIGVTPIERDIPAGVHMARLVRDGRMGSERKLTVESGALAEVHLDTPPEGEVVVAQKPRTLPIVTITLGVVAVGAGAGMWFGLHKEPTVDDYETVDWKSPGQLTMLVGGVVAVTGVVWFIASKNSSGPTVGATTSGDATIGWTGRF
jgi:hypothetical protein